MTKHNSSPLEGEVGRGGAFPALLVTLGDPNGIGPEVAAKSVRPFVRSSSVVLIGPSSSLSKWKKFPGRRPTPISPNDLDAALSKSRLRRGLYLVNAGPANLRISPGRMTRASAVAAFESFELGVRLLKKYPDQTALVTGPVSKEACLRAGIPFTGHTGYLGGAFGVRPVMLLTSGEIGVGLLTEHIPLSEVARQVTKEKIIHALRTLALGLKRVSPRRPVIRVLGLNPHAGEGGKIGTEDLVIAAAVRAFNKLGLGRAVGPIPADSAFSHGGQRSGLNIQRRTSDVERIYLAMYHDQGLIPVKMGGIGGVVNITLGLPAVRTSPAHGTAYDIAGRGIADPRSMRLAMEWALKLSR